MLLSEDAKNALFLLLVLIYEKEGYETALMSIIKNSICKNFFAKAIEAPLNTFIFNEHKTKNKLNINLLRQFNYNKYKKRKNKSLIICLAFLLVFVFWALHSAEADY